MKDVSEEELKQLERMAKRPSQASNEISDEQMVAMVEKIRKGETTAAPKQPKIVEPEESRMQALEFQNQLSNVNFWKIEGLPSKGKFYPEGTEILGRPMKVLEVKKISSITEDNGDFILNDIIRKTVNGIDVNNLYVADKLFIIFWLRANTYRESGYIVPYICPKCNKKSEYHFDINNLEVQLLSDDFSPDAEIKVGNDVIRYDYLRIKDELYINRFREINREAVGEIDQELLAIAQMIKTINGQNKTLLEKYHWIIDLNPGDFSYLKTYVEKKGMGIKPLVTVECKDCGGTGLVPVAFQESFFIPEYKFE